MAAKGLTTPDYRNIPKMLSDVSKSAHPIHHEHEYGRVLVDLYVEIFVCKNICTNIEKSK